MGYAVREGVMRLVGRRPKFLLMKPNVTTAIAVDGEEESVSAMIRKRLKPFFA